MCGCEADGDRSCQNWKKIKFVCRIFLHIDFVEKICTQRKGNNNMAYTIDGKLKVAVSSRALFQLEKEDEIFTTKGKEAYEKYQIKHEKDILQPGAAFPVVKALLELGEDDVEVIVVSRNTADMSLRVFNSIQAHNLNICRGFFTGGESIINYLKSLDIDLFLTANDDSAKAAIDNGIPAATMITSAAKYMTETTELRVAFDGDAVLFGDESEAIFKAEALRHSVRMRAKRLTSR